MLVVFDYGIHSKGVGYDELVVAMLNPLPRDFLAFVLVVALSLLPARHMNIQELSVLMRPCLSHDIQHLLGTRLNRQVCSRTTEISA